MITIMRMIKSGRVLKNSYTIQSRKFILSKYIMNYRERTVELERPSRQIQQNPDDK